MLYSLFQKHYIKLYQIHHIHSKVKIWFYRWYCCCRCLICSRLVTPVCVEATSGRRGLISGLHEYTQSVSPGHLHDDVIKWKHFPRNWPFVREIHRSPVNFPHKGQWRGALMFSLIYAWMNDWVNNRDAGDLRRQHGHYDVIVMCTRDPRLRISDLLTLPYLLHHICY